MSLTTVKPGPRKRAAKDDDRENCFLCDAPMEAIQAIGTYIDFRRQPREYAVCLECIKAAQRRRLRDMSTGKRSVLEIRPFEPVAKKTVRRRQP